MIGAFVAHSRATLRELPRTAVFWSDPLGGALAACAWLSIGAIVIAAAFRLTYPFPLESTEQGSIEQVQRILDGRQLYVTPTLQHVPFIYGPVYYYLSAALAVGLGLSYLPLRLVSLLASIGTLGLVALLVTRETGRRAAGLVAAGLLAATFPVSGIVNDARVDALFVLLLIAGITMARLRPDTFGAVASGVLLGLAALTKLPIGAAPVAVALALYLLATTPARAVSFATACVVTVGLGVFVLLALDGPRSAWYLFALPSAHVINNHGDGLPFFWFRDVLPRLTLPLLIGPLFLFGRLASGDRRPLILYGLVSASLLALSWAARSNSGGVLNVLAPAYLALALLFGLGFDGLLRLLRSSPQAKWLRTYAICLCVVQFALLVYNPRLLVPYRSEQWAAERLSATLTNLDGDLFAPSLDGYVRGSDKGEQPYIGAVLEITGSFGGPGTPEGEQWKSAFADALQKRRFSHVVLIEDCCDMTGALRRAGYVPSGPLFPPNDEYWLWTGGRTPNVLEVYVPSDVAF